MSENDNSPLSVQDAKRLFGDWKSVQALVLAISLAYRQRYTSDLVLGLPPSTAVILRLQFKTGSTDLRPFSLFPQDVFTALHR